MRDPRATGLDVDLDIEAKLRAVGLTAHYRPGTSDERILYEVIFAKPYRRKRMLFDVQPGEHWLDLGANIGAFALYCQLRGATAECYEPDPGCYALLVQNAPPPKFTCTRAAVTASTDAYIPFWDSKSPTDHHRCTAMPMKMSPRHADGELPNVCGSTLMERVYHGIKMDIEGSEGGLLDGGYIPDCKKLVLEYHLWRDPSMAHLRARINFLRSRFRVVQYPPEFDRMMESGMERAQAYYDRLIFCQT